LQNASIDQIMWGRGERRGTGIEVKSKLNGMKKVEE
jgi:hypothetical protein